MKSEVPSFSCAASKRCRLESMRRKSNFPEDCAISIDAAVGQASPRSAAHAAITKPSASAAVIVRWEYFMGYTISDWKNDWSLSAEHEPDLKASSIAGRSEFSGQTREQVPPQRVVHARRHVAVHQQRIGREADDRGSAVRHIVDAEPDVEVLVPLDAAVQIEVVIGADVRIDRKGAGVRHKLRCGELGLHAADVAPIEGQLEAGVCLPGHPQSVAPVRYGGGGAGTRTIRTVQARAVDLRNARRNVDRIVEGETAGEADRQVAGFRRDRLETPDVTRLEIDPAGAVGTGIEAR